MEKIKDVDDEEIQREWGTTNVVPTGLNSFFGKNEFPRELDHWRNSVNENQNPGLALRWVAALAEMEPTLQIPPEDWNNAKEMWRSRIKEEVERYPELHYHTDTEDTQSIVTVHLKHPETGKYLSKRELQLVHQAMTMDLFDWLPTEKEAASKICYIGQPVQISEDVGVLRIALCSDSFRTLVHDLKDPDTYKLNNIEMFPPPEGVQYNRTIYEDCVLIKKLSLLAKYYTDIQKHPELKDAAEQ